MPRVSNITVIDDDQNTVLCEGHKETGTHPKIYLNVREEDGRIECYYCGKTFLRRSRIKVNKDKRSKLVIRKRKR